MGEGVGIGRATDASGTAEGERLRHHEQVKQPGTPKLEWVSGLPDGPSSKKTLAALVESDEARDPAEVESYEAAADPQFVLNETAQRRFRSQFRRRLRHLAAKERPGTSSSG